MKQLLATLALAAIPAGTVLYVLARLAADVQGALAMVTP